MSVAPTVETNPLTPEQLAAYRRDGFVIVRGLYVPDEVVAWKPIMNARIQSQGQRDVGICVWWADVIHPVLREAICDGRAKAVLQQVIGPNVEFLSAKAVYKDKATNFASPWHQDYFYWGGSEKVSIWIALDDATPANGALKVIPGSHKMTFKQDHHPGEQGFTERIADELVANLPVVTAEVKRGDGVIFSDRTVHASHPNTAGIDRWSLISTYRDASVKDESKTWAKSLLMCGRGVNG